METTIILFFAALLATFCLAGAFAPRFLKHSVCPENEILNGTVVATDKSFSVVCDRGGNLYCLRQSVPEDTEIIFTLPSTGGNHPASAHAPLYQATENFIDCARIIRRLNDDFVLCFYRDKKIFVGCTLDVQTQLQQKHDSEAEGKREFPFVLPIRRTDKELLLPVCFLEH